MMAEEESSTTRNGESPQEAETSIKMLDMPEMRYQEPYVWLIFLSSLDIMLTWLILRHGGEEVNPIAKLVIDTWGLTGAVLFKFGLMLFVIIMCEIIGRKQDRMARMLIYFGVAITGFPPVWSITLLILHGAGLI